MREVQDTGESVSGVAPGDLLVVSNIKFFRGRGLEEIVSMPYDVHGNLSGERYLDD